MIDSWILYLYSLNWSICLHSYYKLLQISQILGLIPICNFNYRFTFKKKKKLYILSPLISLNFILIIFFKFIYLIIFSLPICFNFYINAIRYFPGLKISCKRPWIYDKENEGIDYTSIISQWITRIITFFL